MISLAIPPPSVAGVPHVVDCIGGPVLPATEHPHPAVVDHAVKIVARPPVSLRRHWVQSRPFGLRQTSAAPWPPRRYNSSLKTTTPALSRGDHGAAGVTRVQSMPSSDTYTSFKKPSVERSPAMGLAPPNNHTRFS